MRAPSGVAEIISSLLLTGGRVLKEYGRTPPRASAEAGRTVRYCSNREAKEAKEAKRRRREANRRDGRRPPPLRDASRRPRWAGAYFFLWRFLRRRFLRLWVAIL